MRSLLAEIGHYGRTLDLSQYHIDTIFFGGGTPNLLSHDHIEQVLAALHQIVPGGENMEIGMEINPGEASLDKLKAYHSIGINRMSIGMQSFQPELLKFMSRIHTVEQSIASYHHVREAGFENVSADLIFAVPGQSRELWESDLQRLIEMNPEHISTYSLTVEEGTALKRWVDNGHVDMLEDIIDTGMYTLGRDLLEKNGYDNYEISNFSKPGYECRHNMNYWTGIEYLGFGPAAHSYFDGRRHWNYRDLDKYMSGVTETGYGVEEEETIDSLAARNEMILTRLRLSKGLDLSEFSHSFGIDLLQMKQTILKKWKNELVIDDGRLKITKAGWPLIDEISSDLMDA